MISLSLVITNPFNDRMGVIKKWYGSSLFFKFWEVSFNASSDIIGLVFHIRTKKDLDHGGFFMIFGLLGYELIFDFHLKERNLEMIDL